MIKIRKVTMAEKHLIAHHEHISKRTFGKNISQGLADTFIRYLICRTRIILLFHKLILNMPIIIFVLRDCILKFNQEYFQQCLLLYRL